MCDICFIKLQAEGENPPEGVRLVGHRKPTEKEIEIGLSLESRAHEALEKYANEQK